ncbi:MAG: hypothetical protein Q7U18_03385 [Methylobacter sp.]|uniref:hypothetical protein n=1 Tax=Methylobacter sp. G7 TaxID=3230117 RepID=UPI002721F2A7|nr:hypothetical protein [Methylobacter sp.]
MTLFTGKYWTLIDMSNGGDINYSVEALPEKGTPDPSWRYVVFAAYGQLPNIFMFQRGSKTTDQLGNKLLMNYLGGKNGSGSNLSGCCRYLRSMLH